jgi:hypothetical protein
MAEGPLLRVFTSGLAQADLFVIESTVNYWSKYGSIAFDPGQKAVLTSCVLINRAALASNRKRSRDKEMSLEQAKEEAQINCTFSFTIRRDSYNSKSRSRYIPRLSKLSVVMIVPSLIVGALTSPM